MLMKPIVEVDRLEARNRLLERAASLIETDGHVQGLFRTSDGRHCALGAIEDTATTDLSYVDAKEALRKELRLRFTDGITTWNDNMFFFPSIRVPAAIRRAQRQPLY